MDLFSALPAKHAMAVWACMELVPALVSAALLEPETLVPGLCGALFKTELSGPSVAGILCSYAADASSDSSNDPAVPLKCMSALVHLLVAAKAGGSHEFVPTLISTCLVCTHNMNCRAAELPSCNCLCCKSGVSGRTGSTLFVQ